MRLGYSSAHPWARTATERVVAARSLDRTRGMRTDRGVPSLKNPINSGPFQWACGNCALKRSVAAAPRTTFDKQVLHPRRRHHTRQPSGTDYSSTNRTPQESLACTKMSLQLTRTTRGGSARKFEKVFFWMFSRSSR